MKPCSDANHTTWAQAIFMNFRAMRKNVFFCGYAKSRLNYTVMSLILQRKVRNHLIFRHWIDRRAEMSI